jgi:hypothetical protein
MQGLDDIVFTNAELTIGTAAFPKISAQTTTSSTSTCSPTPIPDRTFEFEIEKGFGWSYFSIVTDYIGPNNAVSSDENIGIRQCKSWCAADLNCRTFAFFVWDEAALGAGCNLFSVPYNASYFSYDPTVTNPFNYTKVYEVTNWSPPADLLPNGNFERGCLSPWWEDSRPSISIGVVRCDKNLQDDCLSGNYYLQLNGTDPAREGFGGASVQPVVLPGETYKFTGYVKGAVGSTQEQLSVWFETMDNAPTYTGTGEWEMIEFTFNGSYGGQLTVTADATKTGGLVNWKVDNCEIEKIF